MNQEPYRSWKCKKHKRYSTGGPVGSFLFTCVDCVEDEKRRTIYGRSKVEDDIEEQKKENMEKNKQLDNETILHKATEKAVKNGFDNVKLWEKITDRVEIGTIAYEALIFSHSFAKAFWGDGWEETKMWTYPIHAWKYHLGKMVLEEKPLQYLKKFL